MTSTPTASTTQARNPRAALRARFGISLMFFTNGVLFATMLPRYPELKAQMELSSTAFGLAVIAFPAGALLAAGLAGPLVRRFGATLVMALGTIAVAAFVLAAGTSASVWVFAAALLAAGFADAITDAAQNVHGIVVEQWVGRSIINSLHAVWSLGAATGGIVGATCAARGVPLGTMLVISGILWSAAALAAAVLSRVPVTPRAEDADAEAAPVARTSAWRLLAPLVVLAICGTLMEEIANSWSALYMGTVLGAGAGVAGLGFTVMIGAQFVGRLAGDPMTDRLGSAAVGRLGSLTIIVGAVVALLAPVTAVGLAGLALMGLGCATLVPAAYAAAGRVPGLPHGTGIALMSWLMRIGFLTASPLVGLIADHAGLRYAMVVPLAAGVVATVITHRLATAARRA